MEEKIMSWAMSFALGMVLFFSTLFLTPLIMVCAIVFWWVAPSNTLMQIMIYLVALFLLGVTSCMTIMWKKIFGFRVYHTIVPFIILTDACSKNIFGLNSSAITVIVNRNLSDFFSGSLGKLKIGLFFSIPMTTVILLTFGIPALVKRIREKKRC